MRRPSALLCALCHDVRVQSPEFGHLISTPHYGMRQSDAPAAKPAVPDEMVTEMRAYCAQRVTDAKAEQAELPAEVAAATRRPDNPAPSPGSRPPSGAAAVSSHGLGGLCCAAATCPFEPPVTQHSGHMSTHHRNTTDPAMQGTHNPVRRPHPRNLLLA
jgi:hypothetical protein